jgi:hypothetical protein
VKLTTHLHLVPRSKNEWSYTSTPQYTFMAWCSVKHRDNFTFTFTFTFRLIEVVFFCYGTSTQCIRSKPQSRHSTSFQPSLVSFNDNSVVYRWATEWMIGGSNTGRSWKFFCSPSRPDRVWGAPSLLSDGYQGLSSFPGSKAYGA